MLFRPNNPIQPIGGPEKKPEAYPLTPLNQENDHANLLGKLEILTGESLKKGQIKPIPPRTHKGIFKTLKEHISHLFHRSSEYDTHHETDTKNVSFLPIHISGQLLKLTGEIITKVNKKNPTSVIESLHDLILTLLEVPQLYKDKSEIQTLSLDLQWAIQFSPLFTTAMSLGLPLDKVIKIMQKNAQKAGIKESDGKILQFLLLGQAALRHHCKNEIQGITSKLQNVISSIQIRNDQLKTRAKKQQHSLQNLHDKLSGFLEVLNPLKSRTSKHLSNIKKIAETLSATASYETLTHIIRSKENTPNTGLHLFGKIPDPLKYFLNETQNVGEAIPQNDGGDDTTSPYTKSHPLILPSSNNPNEPIKTTAENPYSFALDRTAIPISQNLYRSTRDPIYLLDLLNAELEDMSIQKQETFQATLSIIGDQTAEWIMAIEHVTTLIQQFLSQIQNMITLSIQMMEEFKISNPDDNAPLDQFSAYINTLYRLQATLTIIQNFSSNPECLTKVFEDPKHCPLVFMHTQIEEGMSSLESLGTSISLSIGEIKNTYQETITQDIKEAMSKIAERIPDYEQQQQWTTLLETIEDLETFTQQTTKIVEKIPGYIARYSHITKEMQESIGDILSNTFIDRIKNSQAVVIELSTL